MTHSLALAGSYALEMTQLQCPGEPMLTAELRTHISPGFLDLSGGGAGLRVVAIHWLLELEGGLELQRQAHFFSTFTPALVQQFRAEEEALELAQVRGRLRHRREHHRIAGRLRALMAEYARGRNVVMGIRSFLETWLLHQEGDLGAPASATRGH